MTIFNQLKLGELYRKKDLATVLGEDSLVSVREGVYSCKKSGSYLLFVDLEKDGKEERFHFNEYFEEDFFHWDSQTTQHINSPRIQSVVSGELEPHLFVRLVQKVKGQTQPFVYCGRLKYLEHDTSTAKPVHIVFQNIDYDDSTDNDDLVNIYLWKPEKSGKTSGTTISKKGVISEERKKNYKKPTTTERSGLVVSRVGQGYYRQQLIEKFDGKCAVTGISIRSILIASHIVPWAYANDHERLDVNNGILLSPLYDALFDKCYISFDQFGHIMFDNYTRDEVLAAGIDENARIKIDKGMEEYLSRHRGNIQRRNANHMADAYREYLIKKGRNNLLDPVIN